MSRNVRAFPVELRAAATILVDLDLKPIHPSLLNPIFEALIHHEDRWTVDLTTVAYVCADCKSIGTASSREFRDQMAHEVDFTCCDPRTTVLFVSTDAIGQ